MSEYTHMTTTQQTSASMHYYNLAAVYIRLASKARSPSEQERLCDVAAQHLCKALVQS